MEPYQLWLIAGLALAAGELLLGEFTLLCVGVATASTALPAAFGMSTNVCIAWLAASMLLLFVLLRPVLRDYAMRDNPNISSNMNLLIGQTVGVRLEDGVPWANAGGDHWRLECDAELADGDKVNVLAVEGSRLRVAPLTED
jgi:membrane protein implicated in regulation of membrane protease activity